MTSVHSTWTTLGVTHQSAPKNMLSSVENPEALVWPSIRNASNTVSWQYGMGDLMMQNMQRNLQSSTPFQITKTISCTQKSYPPKNQ
jgi:DhnA family fructose-bisphosphate aldolase class Ia